MPESQTVRDGESGSVQYRKETLDRPVRGAVRKYLEKPIEAAEREAMNRLAAECNAESGLNIQMIYDENHQILAQGNFVLAVSEGSFGGVPTAYYDLWRIENGKIAEHWDIMETIAEKDTWQNQNGKF